MMRYKNTWHVEHVAMPTLEAWAKEQVWQGRVEKGWQVGTLDKSPWFPGWERKWRQQQGFGPAECLEEAEDDDDKGGGKEPCPK